MTAPCERVLTGPAEWHPRGIRPVAWTCAAHGVTTTGDCPRCDDELIALTEEANS